MTVASNENQSQAQLLRHGELNWVTRGVFLGYQRNYLELQVDDLFLGDDAWDPATHTTNYDPAAGEPHDAGRRRPGGRLVDRRAACASTSPSTAAAASSTRPTTARDRSAGQRLRRPGDAQRLRLDQPHLRPPEPRLLDRRRSSPRRSRDNVAWARPATACRSTSPTEVVTGEHSGLANTRPGNPGTIDPPSLRRRRRRRPAARCRPAPTTTRSPRSRPAGETTASIVPGIAVAAPTRRGRRASFNAVCHAVAYNLYRSPAGADSWTRRGHASRARADDPTDDGTNADRARRSPTRARRARRRRRRRPTPRRSRPTRRTRTTSPA